MIVYIYTYSGQPDSTYKHLGAAWQCIQTAGGSLTVHTNSWGQHDSAYNCWVPSDNAYNCWGQADCIQWLRTGWLHTKVEDRLTAYNLQRLRTGWLHTMVEDRLIAYNCWGQVDCIQWLRTGWQYLPLLRAAWQKTMSCVIRLLSPIPNISMLLQMFSVICQHTIIQSAEPSGLTPCSSLSIKRDSILQCTRHTSTNH